jgi:hypothetical protein
MQELPAGFRVVEQPTQQPQVIELPQTQRQQRESARTERQETREVDNRAFDEAQKLRTEYASREAVKTFEAAVGTYASAIGTAENAQGDQSLITAYAKMLDPNSAVREGEFATTAGTENTLNQIRSRIAKEFGLSQGGMLTPDGRDRIRAEMRNLVTQRFKPAYDRDRAFYSRLSQDLGVDPSLVLIDGIEGSVPTQVVRDLELAAPGSTEERVPLDEQFTGGIKELQAGLASGEITPEQYAAYRMQQDRETFGDDVKDQYYTYLEEGYQLGEAFAAGADPANVPEVTSATRTMSGTEQFLNDAAQTPAGAFAANMGNAGAFGLPGLVAGQDKLEALRAEQPAASLVGEFAGGVTGALTGGAALKGAASVAANPRLASILANPTTTNIGYGSTYGATQDTENPFRGAILGGGAALAGDAVGSYLGRNMPRLFNRGGVRQADEAVPTIDELKATASQQYRDAEAAGEALSPEQVADLNRSSRAILAQEGRITPKGDLIDTDTPVTKAIKLIGDFDRQQMTPTQVGSVRKVLAEGRSAMNQGAPDKEQRRIATMLLENFDDSVSGALPGVDKARATASRYLQAEDISRARNLADADTSWFTQSGPENALRRNFRNLDKRSVTGRANYAPEVNQAIETVARGTPTANAARRVGKFAPTSAIASGPAIAGGGFTSMAGGPGALVGLGIAGGGTLGRMAATNIAKRNAEIAELVARGGPEYKAALDAAIEEGQRRAQLGLGGLFGSAPSAFRQ